jgi:hypothetical protein
VRAAHQNRSARFALALALAAAAVGCKQRRGLDGLDGGSPGAGGASAGAGGAGKDGGAGAGGAAGSGGGAGGVSGTDAGCEAGHLCNGACVPLDSPQGCGTGCAVCTPPDGGTAVCRSNGCDFDCPGAKRCDNACIPTAQCCGSVTACVTGDVCCPAGCSLANDGDCPPAWGPALIIGHEDNAHTTDNAPKIAVAGNGDAFVVFYDSSGTIWARRYVKATDTFDPPFQLSDATSSGANPLVGADGAGNAIAGWYTGHTVVARRFAAGAAWTTGWTAIDIVRDTQTPTLIPTLFDVAVTPAGHAVFAWTERDSNAGNTEKAYFRLYEAGQGWDAVQLLSGASNTAENVQAGIAPAGGGLSVVGAYAQYDVNASRFDVLGAVYSYSTASHSGSLGAAAPLESETASTTIVDVGMDASGNAFVLMGPSLSPDGNGLVNRYTGSWAGATRMNTGNGGAYDLALATSPAGDAFVTWAQGPQQVLARRFTGGAWMSPAMLTSNATSAQNTMVGCDASGRALAVWLDYASGTAGNVMASELAAPGNQWTSAHPISSALAVAAGFQALGFGLQGTGLAAWDDQGGTATRIWGAVYKF